MKKIFVLIIALAVIGTTVAPLVQAQSTVDQRRMEQLAKEAEELAQRIAAQRRAPTAQEQQRLEQLQAEMARIMGVSPEQLRQATQQGNQGQTSTADLQWQMEQTQRQAQQAQQTQPRQPDTWPTSVLSRYGLGRLTKPNGVYAEYEENVDDEQVLRLRLITVIYNNSYRSSSEIEREVLQQFSAMGIREVTDAKTKQFFGPTPYGAGNFYYTVIPQGRTDGVVIGVHSKQAVDNFKGRAGD